MKYRGPVAHSLSLHIQEAGLTASGKLREMLARVELLRGSGPGIEKKEDQC